MRNLQIVDDIIKFHATNESTVIELNLNSLHLSRRNKNYLLALLNVLENSLIALEQPCETNEYIYNENKKSSLLQEITATLKKVASAPVSSYKLKKMKLDLLLNKNNFMENHFGVGWRSLEIIEYYLKQGEYLLFSVKTILFLYQTIIPKILEILKTTCDTTEKNTFVSRLANEKLAIEYNLLARIQMVLEAKSNKNNDLITTTVDKLSKLNPHFKNNFEQEVNCSATNGHGKIFEMEWLDCNVILAQNDNHLISKKYKQIWQHTSSHAIRLHAIDREYSKVVLPHGIKSDYIPYQLPKYSWLHPGINKRATFFQENQYKIIKLNQKIEYLKQTVNNIKGSVSFQKIIELVETINDTNKLLTLMRTTAAKNKIGSIFGHLFFKHTNDMLDDWILILRKLEQSEILAIEEQVAKILLTQSSKVCWDEAHQSQASDIYKIHRFLFPLVGKLVKQNRGDNDLCHQIKNKTTQIYNLENVLTHHLKKFLEGNYINNDIDNQVLQLLKNDVEYVKKFIKNFKTRAALELLQQLIVKDEKILQLSLENIIKKLTNLFEKDKYHKVNELLLILKNSYILPKVRRLDSKEYRFLSLLDTGSAEVWKLTYHEKIENAFWYFSDLFNATVDHIDIELVRQHLTVLRDVSNQCQNKIDILIAQKVRPFIQNYKGENNYLGIVITELNNTAIIIEYGEKLLKFYLENRLYNELSKEIFFIKNLVVLQNTFETKIIEQLNTYTDHKTDISEELIIAIQIINPCEKIYEQLDTIRLHNLQEIVLNDPNQLDARLELYLKSAISFPASAKGTKNVQEWILSQKIPWSVSLQTLVDKKNDINLKRSLALQWFDAILKNPQLAEQYKEKALSCLNYENLFNDFGEENIVELLIIVERYLKGKCSICATSLNVINLILSEPLIKQFAAEEIRSLYLQVYKNFTYQTKCQEILKNLILLTNDRETVKIIIQLKELSNLQSFMTEEAEYATLFNNTMEQYIKYLVELLVDQNSGFDKKTYIFVLLKMIINELPEKISETLDFLKANRNVESCNKLSDLLNIKTSIGLFIEKRMLELDINVNILDLLKLLPKDKLVIFNKDLIDVGMNLSDDLPVKPIIDLLQIVTKSILENKDWSLTIEQQNCIRDFAIFKQLLLYLIDLLAGNQNKLDINTSSFTSELTHSYFAKYTKFWAHLAQKVCSAGLESKIPWLVQKYLSLDISTSSFDESLNSTSDEELINRYERKSLTLHNIREIWEKILIFESHCYDFEFLKLSGTAAVSIESFVMKIYEICSRFTNKMNQAGLFLGYSFPDLKKLNKNIHNDKTIWHDLIFLNENMDSRGYIIDGILLTLAQAGTKYNLLELKEIKNLFDKLANSQQKLCLSEIIQGKSIALNAKQQLYINYSKGLFKMQAISLIHSINNNESRQRDFFAHFFSVKEEWFSKATQIQIIKKVIACQLSWFDKNKIGNELIEIKNFWKFMCDLAEGKFLNKAAKKVIIKFILDNQIDDVFITPYPVIKV